jgi:hypothetical protein
MLKRKMQYRKKPLIGVLTTTAKQEFGEAQRIALLQLGQQKNQHLVQQRYLNHLNKDDRY